MQHVSEIRTDGSGRELTEHGEGLFPVTVYENTLFQYRTRSVPWHWHEECELVYVQSGTLQLCASSRKTAVAQHCAVFINTGQLHAMQSADGQDCTMHNVLFHADVIDGTPSSVLRQKYVRPLTTAEHTGIVIMDDQTDWTRKALALLCEVTALYEKREFGYEIRLRNLLSEIWLLILKHYAPTGERYPQDPYIKDMLTFIHQQYAKPLHLEDIAASAGVSVRTAARSFRKALGMAPAQYLQEYRLQKAAEQLTETGDSVAAVCFDTGFNDASYFTRAFRKYFRVTPKEYRRISRDAAAGENRGATEPA